MQFPSRIAYTKRQVPRINNVPNAVQQWAAALVRWLADEFGNIQRAIQPDPGKTVTADYTMATDDGVILADATAGAVAVTLPDVAKSVGSAYSIKKIDSSANAVTLVGTVDGATDPTLAAQYDAKLVWSNGTVWYTLAVV